MAVDELALGCMLREVTQQDPAFWNLHFHHSRRMLTKVQRATPCPWVHTDQWMNGTRKLCLLLGGKNEAHRVPRVNQRIVHVQVCDCRLRFVIERIVGGARVGEL